MNTSPERIQRLRFDAKSIITISVGVLGLVIIVVVLWSRIGTVDTHAKADSAIKLKIAQADSSAKVKALGCEIIAFVDSQAKRSSKSLQATLAAPAATPAQKATSIANLADVVAIQQDAHAKIKVTNCPPIKHVTRPSTRRTGAGSSTLPLSRPDVP